MRTSLVIEEMVFDLPKSCSGNEAVCIPSNGSIDDNGRDNVMHNEISQIADELFVVKTIMGQAVKVYGNKVFDTGIQTHYTSKGSTKYHVIAFPTRNEWCDGNSMNIVKNSVQQLIELCNTHTELKTIYIPKECFFVREDYDTIVEPMIREILDDRFIIIDSEV